MKIYISGAITNNPNYEEQFAKASEEIMAKGHEAVNPVNLQKVLSPETTTWEQYMCICMPLLTVCDAIYMIDGWQDSKGATQEFRQARERDMIIYRRLEEIPKSQMTKEQAIQRLQYDRAMCYFNPDTGENDRPYNEDCREMAEALDIAIEALKRPKTMQMVCLMCKEAMPPISVTTMDEISYTHYSYCEKCLRKGLALLRKEAE